mmetsp:Transcript_28373/g.61717  ORF Transcript_28373/g.61717 Transcript_28373/m.61717 type:complete len:307 (-) Transcript_28373:91-1011(-)
MTSIKMWHARPIPGASGQPAIIERSEGLTLFLCHETKGTFQWTKVLWGDGGTLIEVANATSNEVTPIGAAQVVLHALGVALDYLASDDVLPIRIVHCISTVVACAGLFLPDTLLSEILQRSKVVGEVAVQIPRSVEGVWVGATNELFNIQCITTLKFRQLLLRQSTAPKSDLCHLTVHRSALVATTNHELPVVSDVLRIRGICEPPGILDAVNKEFSSPYIFNEWIEVVIDQNVVFHRRKPSEGIANERGVEKGPHHAVLKCVAANQSGQSHVHIFHVAIHCQGHFGPSLPSNDLLISQCDPNIVQ